MPDFSAFRFQVSGLRRLASLVKCRVPFGPPLNPAEPLIHQYFSVAPFTLFRFFRTANPLVVTMRCPTYGGIFHSYLPGTIIALP